MLKIVKLTLELVIFECTGNFHLIHIFIWHKVRSHIKQYIIYTQVTNIATMKW